MSDQTDSLMFNIDNIYLPQQQPEILFSKFIDKVDISQEIRLIDLSKTFRHLSYCPTLSIRTLKSLNV